MVLKSAAEVGHGGSGENSLSFVDVFDANVTALGFRIAAPSLRKNWERFPEGRARRI